MSKIYEIIKAPPPVLDGTYTTESEGDAEYYALKSQGVARFRELKDEYQKGARDGDFWSVSLNEMKLADVPLKALVVAALSGYGGWYSGASCIMSVQAKELV